LKTNQHHECYGKLFPDFEHLNYDNQPTDGKAFRVIVQKIGIGTQRRELVVKPEAWDECVACPEYRTCYDLSMARLALHGALADC
jgi:hypothetical protein